MQYSSNFTCIKFPQKLTNRKRVFVAAVRAPFVYDAWKRVCLSAKL